MGNRFLCMCCSMILLSLIVQGNTQQCDTVDSSLMPYCSKYVTYDIPHNYAQSMNDDTAQSMSVPLVDQSVNCPYYDTVQYQCRKLFPRCVESSTSTTPTIVKMCYANCMSAQTYDNNYWYAIQI